MNALTPSSELDSFEEYQKLGINGCPVVALGGAELYQLSAIWAWYSCSEEQIKEREEAQRKIEED